MRYFLMVGSLSCLSACALFSPGWHWEKSGGDYARDERDCKAQTYSGNDGVVTHVSVRRMQACLEARGWRKVAD